MKPYLFFVASIAASTWALAGTPCEEVKTAIAAKLDAKHVSNYSLDVVESEKVGDGKVIGTCEGGAKKIVYTHK